MQVFLSHDQSLAGMDQNEVAEMVSQGKSHKDISTEHKRRFSTKIGFSKRITRRFSQAQGYRPG